MAKILICAATKTEANACKKGIAAAGLANRFEILRTGIGPAEAAETLKSRLQTAPKPIRILSGGFAGSWSTEIERGDWITCGGVANELGDWISLQPIEGARVTTICSVAEILDLAPAPLLQKLADRGWPVTVDMETFALAQVAQNHEIPLSVLRYVTDSPRHPLPLFVKHFTNVATRKDLRGKSGALILGVEALALGPSRVPELLKNGVQWNRALSDGWAKKASSLL